MMLRLFCRTGRFAGKEYRVEREAFIGRGRQNEIDLALDFISRRHAKIRLDEGSSRYLLEDLGSGRGTEIDGTRVRGPRLLPDLCVVSLSGEIDFICQTVPDEFGTGRQAVDRTVLAESAPVPPARLAPETGDDSAVSPGCEDDKTVFDDAPLVVPRIPAEKSGSESGEAAGLPPRERPLSVGIEARGSGSNAAAGFPSDDDAETLKGDEKKPRVDHHAERPFVLVLHLKGGSRKEIALPMGETAVGRQEGCPVLITHPTVGRRQAVFIHGEGFLKLRDLGAANPTVVDGGSIAGREVELRPGSRIEFGVVRGEIVRR